MGYEYETCSCGCEDHKETVAALDKLIAFFKSFSNSLDPTDI